MAKKQDPIYTALGQQQRAQKRATKKLIKLTPKIIREAQARFSPVK